MILNKATTKKLIATILSLAPTDKEVIMLMVGEKTALDYDQLIKILNKKKIHFFGAIFPFLIHQNDKIDDGVIIKKLPFQTPPQLIEHLSKNSIQIPAIKVSSKTKTTVITFVDGLAQNIPTFLRKLYNEIGDQVNYIGAGAGYLNLRSKPCILSKKGLSKNSGIYCFISLKSQVSVKHGWQKMMGPVVATKTDGNTIKELNWESALSVYSEVLEKDIHEKFTAKNFKKYAFAYPFGMYKEGSEMVVRDPIRCNIKGEIICIGEVPQNSVLYILKGDPEEIIRAARVAAEESLMKSNKKPKHTFVVNCISRLLFLKDRYVDELATINSQIKNTNEEAIPQGVFSIGEISTDEGGKIEFYNKTLVVSTLY